MSRDVVVVDGLRTPYAKANTELKDVAAQDLGRIVTVELLARTDFDPVERRVGKDRRPRYRPPA